MALKRVDTSKLPVFSIKKEGVKLLKANKIEEYRAKVI